ncbi:MAG TPA: hypothetical protein VMW13_00705 [Dehalococcoidales bacterium]|nr:hypothetical protein [Dehalococcoidales bacterium]
MPEESLKMPEVPFGPHTISRLIVGGNQQNGASHQSKLMGMHMLEYFTVDRTVAFLRRCIAQGINTWQANSNEKVRDVLLKLREEGEEINFFLLNRPIYHQLSNLGIRHTEEFLKQVFIMLAQQRGSLHFAGRSGQHKRGSGFCGDKCCNAPSIAPGLARAFSEVP